MNNLLDSLETCCLCGGSGDLAPRFSSVVEAISSSRFIREALSAEQAEVISRGLEALEAQGVEMECEKCRGYGLRPKEGTPGWVDWEAWLEGRDEPDDNNYPPG